MLDQSRFLAMKNLAKEVREDKQKEFIGKIFLNIMLILINSLNYPKCYLIIIIILW